MFKSLVNAPPNGWQFIEPTISPEPMVTWDLGSLVNQVIEARKRNPRHRLDSSYDAVYADVLRQNEARVRALPGTDIFFSDATTGFTPPPKTSALRRVSQKLAAAAGGVVKVNAGVGVLLDWLGSGAKPVADELAEQRAAVCVDCPKNTKGNLTDFFTVPASDTILKQLEIRKDMNLKTTRDFGLNVCSACLCPMKLKVHVPMSYIQAKMNDKVKSELDPRCWMLKEWTA